jgi:nitrite reductase (NO-forming) / hydroxylamine reductase
MMKLPIMALALATLVGMNLPGSALSAEPTLSEADFAEAKNLYFQRCAGCHGVLRKGATGKSLLPKETTRLGQKRLEKIITLGTEGGMNNFDDLFSKEQIAKLATFIQMDVPAPAELSLAEMKKRWRTYVKPADYHMDGRRQRIGASVAG